MSEQRTFIREDGFTYELVGITPFRKIKVDVVAEMNPFVTEKAEDVLEKIPFVPTSKEVNILRENGIKAIYCGFEDAFDHDRTGARELYLTKLCLNSNQFNPNSMSAVSQKIITDLESAIASLKEDHAKFEKGNSAAGTRVRNTAQSIKVLSQELRVDVQETKNKV